MEGGAIRVKLRSRKQVLKVKKNVLGKKTKTMDCECNEGKKDAAAQIEKKGLKIQRRK